MSVVASPIASNAYVCNERIVGCGSLAMADLSRSQVATLVPLHATIAIASLLPTTTIVTSQCASTVAVCYVSQL